MLHHDHVDHDDDVHVWLDYQNGVMSWRALMVGRSPWREQDEVEQADDEPFPLLMMQMVDSLHRRGAFEFLAVVSLPFVAKLLKR